MMDDDNDDVYDDCDDVYDFDDALYIDLAAAGG